MPNGTPAPSSGHENVESFLRPAAVRKLFGLSRTTLHRMVRSGNFPTPRRLGARAVGWRESDLRKWQDECPSARIEAAEVQP